MTRQERKQCRDAGTDDDPRPVDHLPHRADGASQFIGNLFVTRAAEFARDECMAFMRGQMAQDPHEGSNGFTLLDYVGGPG